ncbi:hypothetical protein WA158_002761 [Blastocystis sp. Blastoise]
MESIPLIGSSYYNKSYRMSYLNRQVSFDIIQPVCIQGQDSYSKILEQVTFFPSQPIQNDVKETIKRTENEELDHLYACLLNYVQSDTSLDNELLSRIHIDGLDHADVYHIYWDFLLEERSPSKSISLSPYTPEDDIYHGPSPSLYSINITTPSSFNNHTIQIDIPNTETIKTCSSCQGYKKFVCRKCLGSKRLLCSYCNGIQGNQVCIYCKGYGVLPCEQCKGKGTEICKQCNQTGKITCRKMMDVKYSVVTLERFIKPTSLSTSIISQAQGETIFSQESKHICLDEIQFDIVRDQCLKILENITDMILDNNSQIILQKCRIVYFPTTVATADYDNNHIPILLVGSNNTFTAINYPKKYQSTQHEVHSCCNCF